MEIQLPYSSTTEDVTVEVTPEFIESESNLEENAFAFSYSVKIKNTGNQIIQLINRHWKVFSADIQIADIKGEGVIGQQPVIKPGEEHSYNSWTVTRDSVGFMCGTYTFYSAEGFFFDVEIPKFDLIYVDTSYLH